METKKMISFHFISFYLTFYFLSCILHCKKYKLKTYYLTLQSSVHQATPPQEIMTPVTRQTASIHIGSHTSRYDYLNAARKNIATDDNKQDYDQECFDGGDDAGVSISTRTTRNSKLKQQQQTATITKKSKTVAFANQNQKQEQEPAQEQQQQPKGKMLSKRQAKKYDAQIEAVEAASILASIAAAAASASKKERTPPYWTRQHEKAKAGARHQKAMSSVLQCDE
jgi:outer membrane protein assembly factor BamE (lipoprotein component of BamABCDE complex)